MQTHGKEANSYLLLVFYEKGHLIQIMHTTPSLKQKDAKLQNDCSVVSYFSNIVVVESTYLARKLRKP
jgi:hypothetical protein